jgi:hypothetical protein
VAIPVVSDQLFTNGARIAGLPPAIANGQPLTYEQLGGSVPVEPATLTFPYDQAGQSLVQAVPRPGALPSQSCECWFASTTEDDENEIEMLEGVTLRANCEVDKITFFISSPDIESGVFKIKYRLI